MSSVIVILKTPRLELELGAEARCELTIHNVSTIVEQFTVSVVGDAADWASVEPEALSLFPNTQHDITVSFKSQREWHVAPGEIPFGVRVTPANDPEGSVVEEGVLVLSAYQQIAAELIPQVTMGKRKGKLGLAIDSRSNVEVPVALRGRDPSDTLAINIKPRNLVLQPGTTTFAKLKIVPRHRYLRGPQKQARFKVAVEPEGGDTILLDATLIQQALLPKGSFVGLGALALLAGWFLVIRPSVKNAAVLAIQPQLQSQQKQQVAVQQQLATTKKQVSQVTKKVNQVATTTTLKVTTSSSATTTTAAVTTTTAAPTTTTVAASSSSAPSTTTTTTLPPAASGPQLTPGPYSNATEVVAAPGQVQQGNFVIPAGNALDLTDIIIENLTQVNGSTVQVGLLLPGAAAPKYFFEMSLTQLTSQDFSLKTPLVLQQGYTLVITVSCAGGGTSACAANVYYDGTAQLTGAGA